ncbi:hypothetical protein ACSBR2_032950 [Camellia fascicularis]
MSEKKGMKFSAGINKSEPFILFRMTWLYLSRPRRNSRTERLECIWRIWTRRGCEITVPSSSSPIETFSISSSSSNLLHHFRRRFAVVTPPLPATSDGDRTIHKRFSLGLLQDVWPKPALDCCSHCYNAWDNEGSPCWCYKWSCSPEKEE